METLPAAQVIESLVYAYGPLVFHVFSVIGSC